MIFVTGGAGFIGANFVLDWLAAGGEPVLNLDKLTYAGNLASLEALRGDARHVFAHGDIGDRALTARLFAEHCPRAVLNFAAESHVDRSIHAPGDFVQTNLVGTQALLDSARAYWSALPAREQAAFRFLHVSTDEVYGSLEMGDAPFSESHPYAPNSPYAASKAGSDHLVRAYHHTYGLPTLTTNCSNNYGPYQFPEKLVPLMVLNALRGQPLPIYGDGLNVRDWLYVSDHCAGLRRVLEAGAPGATYNIGGEAERTNLEMVGAICAVLDELKPRGTPHAALVTHVRDRPGHDRRYAIDAARIRRELGWKPAESFDSGLRKTVAWYLEHEDWVRGVTSGEYRNWMDLNYRDRETA